MKTEYAEGICLRTLYLRDNHVVYLPVMHMTCLNRECCMNFTAAHDRCRLGFLRQGESFTTIELAVSTLGNCHEENENKEVLSEAVLRVYRVDTDICTLCTLELKVEAENIVALRWGYILDEARGSHRR